MKFLLDLMLGKLARYLRFLGYDTFYTNHSLTDEALMKIAEREDRIIVTRDRAFAKIAKNAIFLKNKKLDKQLIELNSYISLNTHKLFTRCSICNTVLKKIDKEQVKDVVPEFVYKNCSEFYICEKCNKVYWHGSHTKNIIDMLNVILQDKIAGNNENY